MKRRNFVQLTCLGCLGTLVGTSLLESCTSAQYVTATFSNNYLQIQKSDFISITKEKKTELPFVLVKHDALPFPICIYKIDENEYRALYMECTHQGCELKAYTTQLVCPCHGSEFDNQGKVLEGPADEPLKQFDIKTDPTTLYIKIA
jgi:cytochrome b6-f complex iron-sulfur subunit